MLSHPGALGAAFAGAEIVVNPGIGFHLMTVIGMTSAALFVMWIADQITTFGVGNGASLIIAINILARLPGAIASLYQLVFVGSATGDSQLNLVHLLILVALFIAVTVGAIVLTEGVRKIPIRYAQQRAGGIQGRGSIHTTYLPLRVNYANVMPIIFAGAILSFFQIALRYLPNGKFTSWIATTFQYGSGWYMVLYGALLMLFAFFWVANQFKPLQIADDLQKNNGYIPGIRPGKSTSDFLDYAMTRITVGGGLGLLVLAILPMILTNMMQIPGMVAQFFGGTSLLIMVGVVLDTMRQVQTYLISHNYDGFISKGVLRSRRY
ncbi:MAG: preprotein translocase subunit SecY, partial [Victivallales bacterium]|nr:preprotein translocase subunit SecY [Victivallales bacterium]